MRVQKRRRREGKTDYRARLNLLKSELPRVVIRKTNRYIIAQFVKSENAEDKVVQATDSKELLKYGWPQERAGSLKSLPACYLTGFLLGKKVKNKIKENIGAILDIGLARNVAKGRIYSVLKGVADAGIEVKHKKDILPEDRRIRGEHLKNKIKFDEIKNKILK